MKPADIRLVSSDLDGTLLGSSSATERFAQAWSELPRGTRPLLVYNTGRSVRDTLATIPARGLPQPDYIIGALGTELHDAGGRHGDAFRLQFGEDWNIDAVDAIVGAFPQAQRQPGEFRHGFKSSWHWARARSGDLEVVRARLAQAKIRATVIYSCRYFLDVIPACAGKGQALAWLCRRLGVPTSRVLVAGDTGNDTEMFLLPGINGLVVENALPELLAAVLRTNHYVASMPMADGVIEGMRAFGILGAVSDRVLS